MDKNYLQLQQRVVQLEKQYANFLQSNSIPLNVERSLAGRGFLTTSNFMAVGQTQVGVSGSAIIPIAKANKYSIAFANYANFPDSGVVDAYIESDGLGGYQLHLEAVATQPINYVVFLNNNVQVNVN